MYQYQQFAILLRGGGDIATGIALRLYRSGFRRLIILETAHPMAVRRRVAFSEAVYEAFARWKALRRPSLPGPKKSPRSGTPAASRSWSIRRASPSPASAPKSSLKCHARKRNVGVGITDAPLVIGVGPGFTVGENVHCIVETNRGHNLGRVLYSAARSPIPAFPATSWA